MLKKHSFNKYLPTIEKIFFGLIIIGLILKYFLITNITITDNEAFLRSYKFTSSDSYDWISNGVNLFNWSIISIRNIGLPIIIYILYSVNALFLLPLVNQFVFFGILIYIYKSVKLFSNQLLGFIAVVLLFFNVNIQTFSGFILADLYAIFFILASLYYLMLRKYKLSFSLLGLSIFFQNFGLFLLVFYFVYIFFEDNNKENLKKVLNLNFLLSYGKKNYLKYIKYFVFFANLNLLLWAFKIAKYGNPFYSKIDHFAVLAPNLGSIPYYTVNSISMFGISIIFICLALTLFYKKLNLDYRLKFLAVLLTFNIIFWVIIYDWDDRRFLIYFIPFLFPLLFYTLKKIFNQKLYLLGLIVIFLSIYPAYWMNYGFFDSDKIFLTHSKFILFTPTYSQAQYQDTRRSINSKELIFPYYYWIYTNRSFNKNESSIYQYYSDMLDDSLNRETGDLCTDMHIDGYSLRTIYTIKYKESHSNLNVNLNCE